MTSLFFVVIQSDDFYSTVSGREGRGEGRGKGGRERVEGRERRRVKEGKEEGEREERGGYIKLSRDNIILYLL